MKAVERIIIILLLLSPTVGNSQGGENQRNFEVLIVGDTLTLDTLSILPSSFSLQDISGKEIDTALYHIDFAQSILIDKKSALNGKTLKVRYITFPFNFVSKKKHKDLDKLIIEPSNKDTIEHLAYRREDKQSLDEAFELGGLQKNGSISRGVSFGNNQDLAVNSDLNLQLAGKLNNDVDIRAVITDNNIPIQPDGNTQQIQEFDKVYVQLSKGKSELIAGDYELHSGGSYFMKLNKKAQGGAFKTAFDIDKEDDKNVFMQTSLAGAVSKGKFSRNTLQVIEGNQGPYRLRGANNESFIIVIAGTEKVYVDGKLAKRGQDYDYTIDYNSAEISFTPNLMVTKDKRIIVEFEYSDKNYARSMFYSENKIGNEKWNFRINAFTEQDLRNQPLDLDLSDGQKNLLGEIGDSLSLAYFPFWDTAEFSNDRVLYKLVDTIVNGVFYDSVLKYSTNPDSAFFEANFSFIGEGKGNYIQAKSSANGRVFQWVAPVGGISQGNYEPVVLLPTPKKKQMVSLASDIQISKTIRAGVEISLSSNDVNTFSSKDDNDNTGYGLKAFVNNKMPVLLKSKNRWVLNSVISHELVNKLFVPIDRYRSIEFERDWNLQSKEPKTENISTIGLLLKDDKISKIGYEFKSFLREDVYHGLKNSCNFYLVKSNFHLSSDASLLNGDAQENTSEFVRYKSILVKKTKWMNIGLQNEAEKNRFLMKDVDSLLMNSFQFAEWQAFVTNSDTAVNLFNVNYTLRDDYRPKENSFSKIANGESVSLMYRLQHNPNNRIGFNATYRKLNILDTLLTSDEPDENFVGRVEYFAKQFNGILVFNLFYEAGTGQEVKKEYSYLEVSAGQGVYKWTDYNKNSVKELDEFDIAIYQDEANYIRVYIPTNEYIKSYYNQYSNNVTLDPAKAWRKEKGLKKVAALFTDQFYYNIRQKSTSKKLEEAYNPFQSQLDDSILLTYAHTYRNTIYFNKRSNVFSIDYTMQKNSFKNLMVNGFESRVKDEQQLNLRWNITKEWMFKQSIGQGQKASNSEYFDTRDFEIDNHSTITGITFQPSLYFRVGGEIKYEEKLNKLSIQQEKSIKRDIGLNIKYSKINRSTLQARFNYIVMGYNASEDTPLAFEMLESLREGENITWVLSFQRNLSGHLQLGLRYNGRKLPEVNTIHVGSVQLRAYF